MRGPTGACCSRKAARSRAIPSKPRWIVDPLDGTTNFLHGVPHFSISIAVEEKKPDGQTGDHPRPGLSAADRRELLGGKGPRRLAQRPPPARLGAPRPCRCADRHRHSPLRPRRCPADWSKIYGAVAPAGCRHPPLRLGRARLRLGRGGADGRLLGRRSRPLGHRGGRAAGQARRAASSAIIAGQDRMFERREYLAASAATIHSRLHKLLAGALR